MSFVYPWVLLFLAAPIMLAWTVLARRPGIVMPFDHQSHRGSRVLRFALGFFDAAPLLLMAVAITILAGPQLLKPTRKERELTNIQICMDVSGSMSGPRYQRASQAIVDFTKAREGDAFGLMIFGSAQMRWVPITRDLNAIRNAMPFANPDNQPPHMGGTLIGAALKYALNLFEAEAAPGDRMIILVSDGDSSDLGHGEEFEIGESLRAAGITLYHIHVAEDDIPNEVVEMAKLTGGQAMAATDPSSLKEVFSHIDRMKPAKFKPVGTAPLDHFRPFAIIALCLAGLHFVGLLGVRYTPW
jgi:Ca-activated chloride channel family protein